MGFLQQLMSHTNTTSSIFLHPPLNQRKRLPGQVVLNISQFWDRTVELLRTTESERLHQSATGALTPHSSGPGPARLTLTSTDRRVKKKGENETEGEMCSDLRLPHGIHAVGATVCFILTAEGIVHTSLFIQTGMKALQVWPAPLDSRPTTLLHQTTALLYHYHTKRIHFFLHAIIVLYHYHNKRIHSYAIIVLYYYVDTPLNWYIHRLLHYYTDTPIDYCSATQLDYSPETLMDYYTTTLLHSG